MATQSTAGRWNPHCSSCFNVCTVEVNDYGFDYEGPNGGRSRDDFREESDCCNADVVTDTPTCTGCDSNLDDDEHVFWTHGSLLCEDCQTASRSTDQPSEKR